MADVVNGPTKFARSNVGFSPGNECFNEQEYCNGTLSILSNGAMNPDQTKAKLSQRSWSSSAALPSQNATQSHSSGSSIASPSFQPVIEENDGWSDNFMQRMENKVDNNIRNSPLLSRKVLTRSDGIDEGREPPKVSAHELFSRRKSGPALSHHSSDEVFDDNVHYTPKMGRRFNRKYSIVDDLLFEIYDKWHYSNDSFDSDTFTEYSTSSEAFHGRHGFLDSPQSEYEQEERRVSPRYTENSLANKSLDDLKKLTTELKQTVASVSGKLVRQLKRRDHLLARLNKHNDLLTAVLQASSLKRRIDTRIKFTLEPSGGDDGFQQWLDAMKAVARLPLGLPAEFRKKVWLTLADKHIESLQIDWEKTKKFAFNEKSNPDDNKLGLQIVKDLHRTGCSSFSGHENEEDRAVLKRVLLAYARWNKLVGYCQGFNVLAALILEVVNRKEDDAFKVMIFLIDHVLPESYFANNLRALSVDMAVFRDLLQMKLPELSKHLDYLQQAARDHNSGTSYEPPLTNVFTMQWFLTLFAACLPKDIVLQVWDSILLEGSEILLRTALVIWERLADRIMMVESADEFYSTMGVLTQEMLDSDMFKSEAMIKNIYNMAPMPFPQVKDLREKYTYNITPFTAAVGAVARKGPRGLLFSDDDEIDDEDLEVVSCFTGIFHNPALKGAPKAPETETAMSKGDISKVSPGAYAASSHDLSLHEPAYLERMNTDLGSLRKQYGKLKQRQQQAHILLAAASARHHAATVGASAKSKTPQPNAVPPPIKMPIAINHLFVAKQTTGPRPRKGSVDSICVAPARSPIRTGRRPRLGDSQDNQSSTSEEPCSEDGRSSRIDSDVSSEIASRKDLDDISVDLDLSQNAEQTTPTKPDPMDSSGLGSSLESEQQQQQLLQQQQQQSSIARPTKLPITALDKDVLDNAFMAKEKQEITAAYVATLTYKTHKQNQDKSPTNADASPAKERMPFHPFPVRTSVQRRMQNGVKLGLYSQDYVPPVLNDIPKKASCLKGINRSHINVCLHRHYMAQVKESANKKSEKS